MSIFQGGFLGLDISWMAMYTLNLLAIALELSREDRAYEDVASKFWEQPRWGVLLTGTVCPGCRHLKANLTATELSQISQLIALPNEIIESVKTALAPVAPTSHLAPAPTPASAHESAAT